MTRTAILCVASIAAALSVSSAFAQQPTRIRGAVETVAGATLTVRPPDGETMTMTLADNTEVYALVKAALADIKPGAFVGIGAMPQPDGGSKAIQVAIFAEPLRGVGEGHRPWDRPGTTMTNGTVDTTVTSVDGQVLTVKYKGGEQKITVTPDSAIRAYVVSDKNELKPGANIATFAAKNADGTFSAARITVGRDGIAP